MAPHLRPLDRLLLVNTGRSFQVHEQGSAVRVLPAGATPATAPVENGSASKGYTVLHGRRYDFYQVHWHTPSEHLVDGRHAALEVPLTRLAGLSLSADTIFIRASLPRVCACTMVMAALRLASAS